MAKRRFLTGVPRRALVIGTGGALALAGVAGADALQRDTHPVATPGAAPEITDVAPFMLQQIGLVHAGHDLQLSVGAYGHPDSVTADIATPQRSTVELHNEPDSTWRGVVSAADLPAAGSIAVSLTAHYGRRAATSDPIQIQVTRDVTQAALPATLSRRVVSTFAWGTTSTDLGRTASAESDTVLPASIASDTTSGEVVVVDSANRRLLRLSAAGAALGQTAWPSGAHIDAVALDPVSGRVHAVDLRSGDVFTGPRNGALTQSATVPKSTSGAGAVALFVDPSTGHLWIRDYTRNSTTVAGVGSRDPRAITNAPPLVQVGDHEVVIQTAHGTTTIPFTDQVVDAPYVATASNGTAWVAVNTLDARQQLAPQLVRVDSDGHVTAAPAPDFIPPADMTADLVPSLGGVYALVRDANAARLIEYRFEEGK